MHIRKDWPSVIIGVDCLGQPSNEGVDVFKSLGCKDQSFADAALQTRNSSLKCTIGRRLTEQVNRGGDFRVGVIPRVQRIEP